MKRIIIAILILSVVFLVGCQSQEEVTKDANVEQKIIQDNNEEEVDIKENELVYEERRNYQYK